MIKGGIIAIKSFKNQAFTGIINFSAGSLNNVHEPRNDEFTAFLGSFLPDDNQMTIILENIIY